PGAGGRGRPPEGRRFRGRADPGVDAAAGSRRRPRNRRDPALEGGEAPLHPLGRAMSGHRDGATVALADAPATAYSPGAGGGRVIARALAGVTGPLGWSDGGDNLFGRVIPAGARVLVKPNLVLHENEGPWGIEPLVTHASIIEAVVEAALRAKPTRVVV